MFTKFNLTLYSQDKSLFIKKKNFINNYNNLYGQNYISFNVVSNPKLLKINNSTNNDNENDNQSRQLLTT